MTESLASKRLVQRPSARWIMCIALAAVINGCAIAPDQRHDVGGVVMIAPPPPRNEDPGTPPQPDYVWLSGYWAWVGSHHEWIPGRWSSPRTGRRWVAQQWVRQGDGWRLLPGHWVRS